MEAGIKPAVPQNVLSNLYNILIDLSDLCISIGIISNYSENSEQKLIIRLLSTALSQARSINICKNLHSPIHTATTGNTSISHHSNTEIINIKQTIINRQHTLWDRLSSPGLPPSIRNLLFEFLRELDQLLISLNPNTNFQLYPSNRSAYPSIYQQVVSEPTLIIDQYKATLRTNYYYPLDPSDMTDAMVENDEDTQQSQDVSSTQTQAEKIEQSIETITDMLNEVEDDDLPVQMQLTNTHPPAQQKDKPSYFKHRFSIYRKISTPYLSTAPNQLNLFKSFSKCIKSIDSQAQILPIRTDRQIHSLSTTD
jgi:hypothetical protein